MKRQEVGNQNTNMMTKANIKEEDPGMGDENQIQAEIANEAGTSLGNPAVDNHVQAQGHIKSIVHPNPEE